MISGRDRRIRMHTPRADSRLAVNRRRKICTPDDTFLLLEIQRTPACHVPTNFMVSLDTSRSQETAGHSLCSLRVQVRARLQVVWRYQF